MVADSHMRVGWRQNWLSSIQEFADEETQRRSWLNPRNGNPHFSFPELFNCYFDGLLLSDGGYAWALKEGLVTAEEATAVEDFHQLAKTYDSPGDDDGDHQAILADPKWADVVNAAKAAQTNLLTLLSDLPSGAC